IRPFGSASLCVVVQADLQAQTGDRDQELWKLFILLFSLPRASVGFLFQKLCKTSHFPAKTPS
ncbi:hypothetical protein NL358_28540, partial [Klebsiella pneumoniae]|nr:hypothetical protein [Klebsiella pneumoniae]